jgi:iron complex outermembrane receptor protein
MLTSKARFLTGVAILIQATNANAQDASGGQTSGPTASSTAPAQTPVQAGPAETQAAGIEDIIVTARRRAENIQSVPISVTAITDTVLRQKSISTPYDLVASTPGVSATSGSASRNDVLYYIRGQGATFNSSPSVVTYFAEVPQQTNPASGGSNITFYDLESVQVLKGPQGTLFGRSTTGGAVLVTPKRPTGEFDGFAEASIGNYGAREFTSAINVPIIGDRLALRVAGNYSYHSGYSKSLTTGQDLDDRNRSSYRISLLAKPTDWLTTTTIFTDQNIDENGTANALWRYEPQGTARLVTDPRLPFNPVFGGNTVLTGSLLDTTPGGIGTGGLGYISVAGLCGNAALAPYLASIGQNVSQCITQRVAILDRVRTGLDAEFARREAGGNRRRLPTTYDGLIRSRTQQVINTTELDFGKVGFLGDTTFKNIFSTTRNLHSEAIREIQGGVGTGIVINDLEITNPTCTGATPDPLQSGLCTGLAQTSDKGYGKTDWFDIWSEEAQLSGSVNDRHDWIIGFFKESTKFNQYLNFAVPFQVLGGAFSLPAGLPTPSTGYNDDYKLTQTGYFGQSTIDFGDFGLEGLRFTAGYRHSIVKNKLIVIGAAITPTGIVRTAAPPIPAKLKQTADSYTFALDYKISGRTLVYGTTRRGFKQGGINFQSIAPFKAGIAGAVPFFDPEKVTDYEVGIKTDYDLGGVAARTNLALFTAKFTGLHRASSFFNGQTTSSQIVNAAGMRSRGLEIEQTFRFSPEFEVNLAYAYLDTKFTEFAGVAVRPADGVVIPRTDSPVTGAPKHKFDLAVRYVVPLSGDAGDLVFAGNASYQSKTNISDDDLFSIAPEAQKGYGLINLRLDWNNVQGNPIDVSFYVKNLTNSFYRTGSGNLISSQLGTTTAIYADPRTYGAQVRVRFGASAER